MEPSKFHNQTIGKYHLQLFAFKCIWQIFLFARLNLLNVLISIAKKIFDSDFPSPCFDVPKASNFIFSGVQNRAAKKQETGNDCDVI